MPKFTNLAVKLEEGVMTITINRPAVLNALNQHTLTELKGCITEAYNDPIVKGVILVGAGNKAFVAGADIKEFEELNELNGRKFSEEGQEVFALFENCHKPVVAVVNGYALGGGCELALACHIRIGTGNAFFGQPEVSLGIIPGFGGTQRLTQAIGKGRALELMMSSRMIGAKEAAEIGLVNHMVSTTEEGLKKAREILEKVFENAPIAVGMIVNCVNAAYSQDENGYQIEANSFASCCGTGDFKEGTSAFLEKRKPAFTGA
jgi:enoyl-CoA hydratase